jgi:hypothetical protein
MRRYPTLSQKTHELRQRTVRLRCPDCGVVQSQWHHSLFDGTNEWVSLLPSTKKGTVVEDGANRWLLTCPNRRCNYRRSINRMRIAHGVALRVTVGVVREEDPPFNLSIDRLPRVSTE